MCSDTCSAPSSSICKAEVSPWTRSHVKAYTKITSHKQAVNSVRFFISLLFYTICALNIYHLFIDFKKAFDSIWHEARWATMKKFNISRTLIETIQSLYENAMSQSAVLVQGTTGEWFHKSVGVRQGCLLSPTLFNIFLDDIMTHVLENYNGTVSIGGRQVTPLRFADDIDCITCEEDELTKLVHNLDTAAAKFGMEISAEKTR